MTVPVHTSLFQQRVHAGATRSFKVGVVWDLVLPGDVQNASDATHVKSIGLSLLSGTQRGCSRRRLCSSGTLNAQAASCCTMLSLSVWSWW